MDSVIDTLLEKVVKDKDKLEVIQQKEYTFKMPNESNEQRNLLVILGFEEARLYDRIKDINEIEKDIDSMKTEEEEIRERKQHEQAKVKAVKASKQKNYEGDSLNKVNMKTPEDTETNNYL